MRTFKFTFFSSFIFFSIISFSFAENQFQSFAIQQAGKLLANPPLFIYEFQRNMESTNPLPTGKKIGLNYHFLGGILIVPLPDLTSAGNLSGKFRLHPEGRLYPGLPQFDMVGGYWQSLLTPLIEDKNSKSSDADTKLKRADLKGYYGALIMTSSLEPRVRLFWGYKYSLLDIDIDLNKSEKILGSSVSSFKGGLKEHTLSAGLEHTYGENKRWILEGGYGVKNNLISAKVSWYRKYLELGLNIYPESVFIMQPQVNFHFNF
ncbi:MAG: hypothetical protein A3I11_00790 [Elusimicrobia bacterium RIFCSPLOWO2_02_FULL_39_32]|nr:MAG: hypothetical protein A3B80_07815 [Elusimicrobia bacterium RIFCSPHIGHO2_02_FULL_39_36]OGR92562.1 MAG: hypothetical protein A3I11_00790 [Elusimicrobia bacterium RIFCSPLOWO2_02_FULL_39_32]OGR99210.1 MAG: hypothetical protein A3G85_06000 [Elusimicrobia bacterium RIFCSPLOWO2_12_FULL_39_28]